MNIVQTFLGTQLSRYYSKQWDAQVEIYSVSFNVFSYFTLKGVKIIDPRGDLVLDANTIRCTYRGFPIRNGLHLKTVYLKDTEFHFKPLEEGSNLSFIIDHFKSDNPKEKEKKDFPVNVGRLEMENVTFSLENRRKGIGETLPDKVNPRDMHFFSIYALMENVQVIRDSIKTNIQYLRTKEKSGLDVKNIQMDATVSPNVIIAKNATVETADSKLIFDASLLYDGWQSMRGYVNNVYMDVKFESGTYGDMHDAYYWARNFPKSNVKARFQGEFKGTVSNFETDAFNIFVGNNTSLLFNSKVEGLPKIQETVFDVDLELLSASIKDLNTLEFPERWNIPAIPLQIPDHGNVMFFADFQGTINDFNAKVDLDTDLGNVDAQVALNFNKETNIHSYKGIVNTSLLELEPISHSDWLQRGQLVLKIMGEGLSIEKMKANIEAEVRNYMAKGYVYDSISIDGNIKGKSFDGNISIADNNLDLSVEGLLDIQNNINCKVDLQVDNANLQPLNLGISENFLTNFSTSIRTDITGENIDHLTGYILIENILLKKEEREIEEEIVYITMYEEDGKNNLKINSNFLDFSVNGDLLLNDIGNIKNKFINDFYPQYNNPITYNSAKDTFDSEFSFEGLIKDLSKISYLFDDKFYVAENTSIQGNYSEENSLILHLFSDGMGFKGIKFDQGELNAQKVDSLYDITFQSPFIYWNDLILMRNAALNFQSNNSIADLDLWWDDRTDSLSHGQIHARGLFSYKNISLQFLDSEMLIQGSPWKINYNHSIRYINGDFLIDNLVIEGDNQEIKVNAELSTDAGNELIIGLQNFELDNLNFFTKERNLFLSGATSGDFVWNRLEKDSYFKVDLKIKNLALNTENLGDAGIKSTWDNRNKRMSVQFVSEINSEAGKQNPLNLSGFYYPSRNSNNLDFDLKLQSFPLSAFSSVINSFASDVDGNIDGVLKLGGELSAPFANGKLKISSGSLLIDYLNTKYYLNDTVYFTKNTISLKDFVINDALNNKAVLNGEASHSGFKNFQFNFNVKADNFLFINTNASSGETYYGTVMASADAVLTGNPGYLDLNINARTGKGTNLIIPINTKANIETQRYIQFASKTEDSSLAEIRPQEIGRPKLGFNITINLVATPDAKVFLPMNFSQFSGEINAMGDGALKLGISSRDGFSIYGTYAIDNGTFRMQLVNLLSKDFKIERGGTIQWSGNPMSGLVDIKAIYGLKASLEPLFENQSMVLFNEGNQNYRKRVDVQSIVKMTGQLSDPKTSFDIQFPYLDPGTQEQAFSVLDRTNERIMMEQTISLLFLGVFYSSSIAPTDELVRDGVSGGVNILASQVGSVISNLTGLNIGLDYEIGDGSNISDRWNVNISENIGDFYVEGRFGFGGTEINTPEAQNASNFTGDVLVGYRISNYWSITAFNRSNVNDFTKPYSPYTQGVGVAYRKDFSTLRELFLSSKKQKKKLEKAIPKKEEEETDKIENNIE